MAISRMVGARIKRKEDPRLITGTGTYVDDIKLHDMQHLAVLRSPHAHARIRRIDTGKAAALPGVLAVLTGGDVRRMSEPLPTLGLVEGLQSPEHPPMAVDKVHHLGEVVAAVVASDRYIARDALDLIEVEYEALPAVVDLEKAMADGAALVHDDLGTNVAYRTEVGTDVEEAFREADVVVKQRMRNQRLIPNPMENRGVVAHYEQGPGTLTVWTSTQIPHMLRGMFATLLRLPEQRVRVVAPDVGGGFGCKLNVYPEDIITAVAAMTVRKPVKWVEDRSESFLATSHGRDQVADVEAAAKKDGTITGLRFRIVADLGAYNQLFTPLVPTLTGAMATGCYKMPSVKAEITGVYTNKTSVDAYRGAGRPEAAYYIERIVDMVAAELGLDPVDVRRRNFIPGRLPLLHSHRPVVRQRRLRADPQPRPGDGGYPSAAGRAGAGARTGPLPGDRRFYIRRDLRHRWLGERDGPRRSDRQGDRADRLLATRLGPGDQLCPARRR